MPSIEAAIIPVTPLQQNCTLIWDHDTMVGAVIDPGGDVPVIRKEIEERGIRIDKIVLTHGHVDHAAGAAELREHLGVEIHGPHEADKFLLDSLVQSAREYGLPGARNVTPDHWLEEGGRITIANLPFEILHCPGHSPGSLVFVMKGIKFALVGDVLFRGSIGRTDFLYGDHDALIEAIRTKLLPLDDEMQFICGHGPGSSIGAERATNPFLQGLATS
ncbi:MAG: MBL fold metallo-hydrolase [Pseudomonadota bacterium]